MPIGDSKGAFYEDEFRQVAAPWFIDPKMEGDEKMVVDPGVAQMNKELDTAELEPSTGMGIEVSSDEIDWNAYNKPTGEMSMTDVGDSPVQRQVDDFKRRAEGPVKPLKDISDEDTKTAIDIALGAGPGIIAGVGSKTAKSASNWFTGADGKARYEIDDSVAKYTPPKMSESGPLSRFLDHPELYKAYPELKNLKVFNDPYYSNKGAVFDTEMKSVKMGSAAAEDKGVLLHEIQHAIQEVESFARGGQPGRGGKDYNLKMESAVNDIRPEYLNLQAKEVKGNLDAKEKDRLDELKTIFKKYSEYFRKAEDLAREHYLSLAGEVEARNVQTRANLTPEERLKYSAESTEDIARSNQIVRNKPSKTTPYKDPVDGFMSY